MLSKKQWLLIGACIVAGYLASLVPGRITITKTDSVEHRFFWNLSPNCAGIETDDYIRFSKSLDKPWLDCSPCSIVKRVGCLAGQGLETRRDGWYCDGRRIAVNVDAAASLEAAFDFNGAVPPGCFFVVGDNPQSYDSRYFGFIETEDIDARLIPLF